MSADQTNWFDEQEGSSVLMTQLLSMALHPFGVIRRRWLWMLPALILGLVGTSAIPLLVTPIYEARATVLVSSQQIPEEFVKSTVSGLDSLANVNSLMGEVLSQRQLTGLIEKYDLYSASRTEIPLEGIIRGMRSAIEIDQQRNIDSAGSSHAETSSIFSITFRYPDAVAAAAVTNDLASIFVNESIEKRSEQARVTTEFLRRQLRRAELDLQEINRQITGFRHDHRGEMPNELPGILAKLERLQTQRQVVSRAIGDAEARLVQLHSMGEDESSPQRQLVDLKLELASELAAHTEEHPNVIALQRRIERLEAEIAGMEELSGEGDSESRGRLSATERELHGLRAQLRDIEESLVELDGRAARIPKNEEELGALERRAEVLNENYVEFLRKVQDAELAENLESAQQGPRVSVLDPAAVPGAPTQSIELLMFIGLGASLALALATGVGLELLDPVVISEEQLEATGAPPLLGAVRELAS